MEKLILLIRDKIFSIINVSKNNSLNEVKERSNNCLRFVTPDIKYIYGNIMNTFVQMSVVSKYVYKNREELYLVNRLEFNDKYYLYQKVFLNDSFNTLIDDNGTKYWFLHTIDISDRDNSIIDVVNKYLKIEIGQD